ncbi:MAG: DUF92 domain-containing protein [Candidatus Kapabacteria bacterium]|jgi:uncharacterized protein (TIGR00297 family)|nr:DUF92 domain-containing protein [Candidatus Kapabacteria bacterium]
MSNELKRKAVHVSMIAWALLIGRIAPWQVNMICFLALLFNIFLLKRITSGTLEREAERQQGYSIGLLAYPAVLLMIGLIWHDKQIVMAIAWGAMAFGDGFASIIGQRVRSPKLSWNPAKTWAGFLGFISVAFPLTWFFVVGLLPESLREGASLQVWTTVIFIAVIAGAVAESQEGFVDDNIAVPIAAAWMTALALRFPQVFAPLPADWLWGLAAVTVFAVGSVALRKIDAWGGVVGWICSFCIFLGGGWTCLGLLFVFFAGGSLASSWKIDRKREIGAAQENGGIRSVVHALSNGGVAAACGVCAWLFPQEAMMWKVMLAASLAAATSDTFSSEFGTLYGRRFVNILTLRRDERSKDGVISLEGLAWGLAGSALVAVVFALGLGWTWAVGVIFGTGLVANLIDSALGAGLQRQGLMNNHSVNFCTTLAAALLVRVLWVIGS